MATGTAGPLLRRRIALTREAADNAWLAAELVTLGAQVLHCPLIRVEMIPPPGVNTDAEYDWLAVTSRRALVWVDWHGGLKFARAACVGESTAEYARLVLKLDPLVPETQTAAALARAMGDVRARRILAPRGDLARDTLPRLLREAGAEVHDPVVYHTRTDAPGARKLAQLLAGGEIDAVVFASPSAVAGALGAGADLELARVYSIGPATTDALRAAGVMPTAEAQPHDARGLLAAIRHGEA